jgi:O-methyltransferase
MKDIFCPPHITSYATEISRGENLILRKLREETKKLPEAMMMITSLQGRLLEFLIRWGGAKRILEIGTFTGYSALAMALALPEDGKLITLDKNEEWAQIAQKYWKTAGVASKIELRLGLAHETLNTLKGPFDMIFIDADKQRYKVYYDFALNLLRPGGLMAFDNTLWGGTVVDSNNLEETSLSLRDLNAKMRDDERIHPLLLPLADGMILAIKR